MVRGNPVCRKEDCSQYDVGLVFKDISSYSDQDKLKFIENVWKPGELYEVSASVECSNSKRHFVWSWLKRFPWLAYSKYLDGAFCLPCVSFGVKTVREEYMGFCLCEDGTTGAAIKDLIIGAVGDLGLSMDDCRGQCYDGAGNMSGRLNGASSLIRAEHDKVIYVHCMNHMLNLCVADTCQLPLVRNMMDVVRKLSEFFDNSPKRQQQFGQQD